MFTFLLIILIVVYLKLVFVTAMRPARVPISLSELNRRSNKGDKTAERQLIINSSSTDIRSILRLSSLLLITTIVLLAVAIFGWVMGILISVFAIILHGPFSRMSFVSSIAAWLYRLYEPYFIRFIVKFPWIMRIIGVYRISEESSAIQLGSRDELQTLIDSSTGILSASEKKFLVNGLSFADVQVETVMTPSAAVVTIKKTEFLGPLTLSELYKSGHSRLPVINQDIDHVIGVLHLQSLLALDIKRSVTAEKAMDPNVFYIRNDQTLHHALAAFLRTHHQLFMVINEYRETVGLLTLDDVIEALLGHKIIDEFESHEDKRLVALRNPHDNNEPKNYEDV